MPKAWQNHNQKETIVFKNAALRIRRVKNEKCTAELSIYGFLTLLNDPL